MNRLEMRRATAAEFETALDWAAAEGWNPGLDDLSVFHATDPDGFLMGFFDEEPVSSISVVRYGEHYGFLGFYIVVPEHRGKGAGIATWDAGLAHLAGRTVGLDGVVGQQDNYRKSGFVLAGRNIRYTGCPELDGFGAIDGVRPIADVDLDAIAQYDRSHFPAPRTGFITSWASRQNGLRREGLIHIADGGVAGYGVIRECRKGYKIGPLFADNEPIAAGLFQMLCRRMLPGSDVSLDVPEDNTAAVGLAKRAGLAPVFETARMYKGNAPALSIDQIFGITTFELG